MKQVTEDVTDVKQVKGDVIDVQNKPTEETFLCLGVVFACS